MFPRAGVTAPTLDHRFGSADGLLSAAVSQGFDQFLAKKTSRLALDDPAADLLWSTSHAAALLHVAGTGPPNPAVLAALRHTAAGVLQTSP